MQSLPSSKHNQQETHNMYILWIDTTVPERSCFCFVMNPCIPYTYVLRPWLAKQLSCCVSCPTKYMNCSTRKWNHHLEISVSLEWFQAMNLKKITSSSGYSTKHQRCNMSPTCCSSAAFLGCFPPVLFSHSRDVNQSSGADRQVLHLCWWSPR